MTLHITGDQCKKYKYLYLYQVSKIVYIIFSNFINPCRNCIHHLLFELQRSTTQPTHSLNYLCVQHSEFHFQHVVMLIYFLF